VTAPAELETVEAALAAHFGHPPQRASISFVGVDSIEILRFDPAPAARAYVSLGMSRHPMSDPGGYQYATEGPRAELMLRLRDPTDLHAAVWRRLALLAAAPTVEGVVYAPDLSMDLGEPLVPGVACTGVVVGDRALPDIVTPAGPVAVYTLLPATPHELAWCRVRGAAALRQRWASAGTDLLDLGRRPAPLD
jgi:hypothetical protein